MHANLKRLSSASFSAFTECEDDPTWAAFCSLSRILDASSISSGVTSERIASVSRRAARASRSDLDSSAAKSADNQPKTRISFEVGVFRISPIIPLRGCEV